MSNNKQLKYTKKVHNIQLNRWFSLGSKTVRYFQESILLCFLKISISLKKTCTMVCSEIPFSKNVFYIETSNLITLEIN